MLIIRRPPSIIRPPFPVGPLPPLPFQRGRTPIDRRIRDPRIDRLVDWKLAITPDQANIGTFTNDGSSTTTLLVTNQNVAAGATIIVAFSGVGSNATLSSVAGGGLTWSTPLQPGTGASKQTAIAWAYAPSGLASGSTITGTWSEAIDVRSAGGASFLGIKTSAPEDGAGVVSASGAETASTWTSGSYAIQAGSLLVGACGNDGGGGSHAATGGQGTEAWEALDVADTYGTAMVYRIESSAGSYAVGGTWGGSGSQKWAAMGFLAAAGGTTIEPGAGSVPFTGHVSGLRIEASNQIVIRPS